MVEGKGVWAGGGSPLGGRGGRAGGEVFFFLYGECGNFFLIRRFCRMGGAVG